MNEITFPVEEAPEGRYILSEQQALVSEMAPI